MENEYISAKEAAEKLGYHVHHVYRLLREGKLEGQRIGGGWVVSAQSVEIVKVRQNDSGKVQW